jgi:hypothetical protein
MVSILQWNAQSIKAHGPEMKKEIEDLEIKPDIICVQETWLSDKKFSIFLAMMLLGRIELLLLMKGVEVAVVFLLEKVLLFQSLILTSIL